ncbi:hypothetical protein O181_072310 [Austropuccinia psidii MF-1]|uniref:Uncharacterized protein n=1 Tax=Austropuccinia psidii MF-1 TaxID=1389203 RepID=A0A9Q3F8G5_9BASI|nr:hypothetical protein [Austropuccinia psidii MF-1]
MSGGIYGVEEMGLVEKSFRFLRHPLLMELQGFIIVSNSSILIEFGTDILDLVTGSRQVNVERCTNVGGPIPVGGRPIYSSSEVPISRINTDGPLANRFHGHIIPSTPRTFQPTLSAISTSLPPDSPSPSHASPALNQAVRPSLITIFQHLQPMASSSRRRDGFSPLPFPAAQVFQRRDCWPIQVTREDPNAASENQEAVAMLFRRVDRNNREVIMYENDRTIPGTASEDMAAKFSWYECELINDFQRSFDTLKRDNWFPCLFLWLV